METRHPNFDREWKLLCRSLKRRSMLRGGGYGLLAGSLATMALVLLHVFEPPFHGFWSQIIPAPLFMLFAPALLLAIAGSVIGALLPVDPARAAAWGDTFGGGRDTVRTALISPVSFQPQIAAEAASALERARTARVPIRGFSGSILVSGAALLVAEAILLLASFFATPFKPEITTLEDLLASPKLLENASGLVEHLAGAQDLANWAAEAGMQRLQDAAELANSLAEDFASQTVTEGEALSKVSELERLARAAGGDSEARDSARELINNPEALETASRMLGQISPEMIENVTQSKGFESLMNMLNRFGNQSNPQPGESSNQSNPNAASPDPSAEPTVEGPSGQPVAGPDGAAEDPEAARFGSALGRLGELMNRNPILRDVLQGQLAGEHGRAALDSADRLEQTAGILRRQITDQATGGNPSNPGASGTTGTDSLATPTEPTGGPPERSALQVELPPVPSGAGKAAKAGDRIIPDAHIQGGEAASPLTGAVDDNKPRVNVTGRELEVTGTDFRSRASRLPPALRDAAGRYFEPAPANPPAGK